MVAMLSLRAAAHSFVLFALAVPAVCQQVREPGLALRDCRHQASGRTLRCGTLQVPEDRARPDGRSIALNLVVIPALAAEPREDPVYWLAGGPGQGAASDLVGRLVGDPLCRDRHVVLVDQRGTGRSNPLRVERGSPDDPSWLDTPLMDVAAFREALPALQERADLGCYATEIAAQDLDAVRRALGHERIDLWGGSYGTRLALVYMRAYPERVRAAVLDGVAPLSFRNPLHHARSAQDALELLFAECRADPACRAAFPELEQDFEQLLARLEAEPAAVEITHPRTGEPVEVRCSRDTFADGLRVMLYYTPTNRRVPLLLHRAAQGDLRPFVETALRSGGSLRRALALGMLLCVTGSEDLPRIDVDEIEAATAGTFLGDRRVRDQLAVGAIWPRGEVSPGYGEEVTVDVPTLLLSGTHDPVTPPLFGERAAAALPHGRHLVVPGCHGVASIPEVRRIVERFLDTADAADLDVAALASVRMPPIEVPAEFEHLRTR